MAIFFRHDYNVPPIRWGSIADVQYAVKVNAEKIYGANPDSIVIAAPLFWGPPVFDYSKHRNIVDEQNVIYREQELDFNGSNSCIIYGDKPRYKLSTYTYSILLKGDAIPLGTKITQPMRNGAETFIFSWDHTSAGFKQSVAHKTGSTWYKVQIVSTTLKANTLYRVSSTYDGTNLKAYLNSNLEGTVVAGTPNIGAGNFSIGSLNLWWTGRIKEFHVIDTAQTINQIELFNELPYALYQKVSRPFYLFLFGGTQLSATLPMITAELEGGHGGQLNATLPMITAELEGGHGGQLNATLPAMTATLFGRIGKQSLEATLPAITSEIQGGHGGFFEATLPAITADIKGGAILEATLPAITASLEGDVEISGDLIVSLPAITANLEGKVNVHGDLACILPAITAELTGTMEVGGNLACTLPMITAELTGFQDISGDLVATLPMITALIEGTTGMADDDGDPIDADDCGVILRYSKVGY